MSQRKKINAHSLQFKVISSLGLILMMALLISGGISLFLSKQAMRKSIEDTSLEEINALSIIDYQLIQTQKESLEKYSINPDVLELLSYTKEDYYLQEKTERIQYLQNVINNTILNDLRNDIYSVDTIIYDRYGIIRASYDKSIIGLDLSQDSNAADAIKSGEFTCGNFVTAVGTDLFVPTVTFPIKNNKGDLLGFASRAIKVEYFKEVFDRTKRIGTEAFIVNKEGKFICNEKPELVGKKIENEELLNIENNSGIITTNSDGIEYIVYYAVIPELKWTVYNMVPRSLFYSSVEKMAFIVAIVIVSILIISSLIIFILTRKIVKPIEILTEKAERISVGELNIEVDKKMKSSDEVGILYNTFRNMADNIRTLISYINNAIIEIDDSVIQLRSISKEVYTSSYEINTSMEEIACISNTQNSEVTLSMEKLNTLCENVSLLNKSNNDIKNQGEKVKQYIKENDEKVKSLIESNNYAVESFERVSISVEKLIDKINSIYELLININQISEQTNLLSLNASIEAARAGEKGKGFTVVANQIRVLSEQTKRITGNIQKSIKDMNLVVDDTKISFEKAREVNNNQRQEFQGMKESFGLMHDSLSKMITLTDGVCSEIYNLNDSKNEVINLVKTINELSKNVDTLSKETSTAMHQHSRAFEVVNKSSKQLTVMSSRVKELLGELKL